MNTSALWTKDFILNCIVCFVVNQSYYMTMVVIADYAATALHASLAEAGLACGIFILGTLFARLFLGGCIERIGLKRSLYIGLFLFLAASLLNIGIHSLYLLYAARFVQGVGFGLSSSTTGTIMAHLVPAARRGANFVMYPAFIFFALSLCFISLSTSGWMLLGAAALTGLGYGTYMSCSQAIIIGLAPRGRMGLATSTFFVFMDLSVGAGPLVLGALPPYAGFRVMYAALAVLLACCAVLYYVLQNQNAAKKETCK